MVEPTSQHTLPHVGKVGRDSSFPAGRLILRRHFRSKPCGDEISSCWIGTAGRRSRRNASDSDRLGCDCRLRRIRRPGYLKSPPACPAPLEGDLSLRDRSEHEFLSYCSAGLDYTSNYAQQRCLSHFVSPNGFCGLGKGYLWLLCVHKDLHTTHLKWVLVNITVRPLQPICISAVS